MGLAGRDNRGYAMAALLVAMSVMAVLMGAILPVWNHMAIREKEEELIFRGNQYARAIGLFQRKFANAAPPTIDVLVEQRFLRKKYKDPITNDDFQPIFANQAMQPMGGPQGQGAGSQPQQPRPLLQAGFGSTGVTAAGGVIGVTSKSSENSIKIFNGRSRYNEWAFVNVQTSQQPGQPGGGGGVPGVQGGPNQGPAGPAGRLPFGMPLPPGARPIQGPGGQRGFEIPPPRSLQGQPTRPPLPGQDGGGFTSPNGSTTFTPIGPAVRPQGQ